MKKNLCGPKLREVRKRLGLKQEDVVAELSVNYGLTMDRSALGRIEQQNRSINDMELFALIRILGIDLSDLP